MNRCCEALHLFLRCRCVNGSRKHCLLHHIWSGPYCKLCYIVKRVFFSITEQLSKKVVVRRYCIFSMAAVRCPLNALLPCTSSSKTIGELGSHAKSAWKLSLVHVHMLCVGKPNRMCYNAQSTFARLKTRAKQAMPHCTECYLPSHKLD